MQLQPDFDLTGRNTLGLRSRARFGVVIERPEDLAAAAEAARAKGLPLRILGGGSNTLASEQVEAVVGVMRIEGRQIVTLPDSGRAVTAGAGEDWDEIVAWTIAQGHGGLENLSLIPGTMGAAPVQNIGAYGLQLSDLLYSVTAWDGASGAFHTFGPEDCRFGYRKSRFKEAGNRHVITEVTLRLPQPWAPVLIYAGLDTLDASATPEEVRQRVIALRQSKLPDWQVLGNAGSFFHNPVVPPDHAARVPDAPQWPQADGTVKLSAGWLIERCGYKGATRGPAGVYEGHALILVNHGGATAADIDALSSEIRTAVEDCFGVSLVQEPIRL
ncbi:UDP-N-acetylmuramate dehydrogenase [Pseudoroseicyclus aestuarii]|uniref:UDP-N-acetylenolpyruvoylglucosamine reductase n=1 Tax=Pseudoroseicyclus aestuarii TaxID=1795041 RepID=A0A318T1Y4_9RHOB|nr:UDP-N-acetylmuramate dehydrogenase [Pseudoroseicyclus aestuarii]PYE84214.1 UDP-N-acetylmuramate dehydrogenase [Pseudoroseicyclus aestuarii]